MDRESYSFEGFTLDVRRGCLLCRERVVDLRPKSFGLLCHLVRNAGRLVSKDELVATLWPSVVVGDDSLARCVSDVRFALGDAGMRIVQTLPRCGYRLDVPVIRLAAGAGEGKAAARRRPSLAVLPLATLGSDARQQYFSDGLTDDLITLLSGVPDLTVIPRRCALADKARAADAKTLGTELGVNYVLEGSVRSDARRLRVNARLMDAGSGQQVWAEHYDRLREDVFEVQDEITQRICGSLVAHVTRSELLRTQRKRPENWAAYDHYLRGMAVLRTIAQGHRAERIPAARESFNQAAALDASYPRPLLGLAMTYFWTWVEPVASGPLQSEFRQPATLSHAVALAQRAVDLDPGAAEAHARLGYLLHWQQHRAEGLAEYDRAFELNPELAELLYVITLTHEGCPAQAIAYMQHCKRLEPVYPPAFDAQVGHAHYLLGEYPLALDLLRLSIQRLPGFQGAHVWHAAAAAQLGLRDEARASVAEVLRHQPQLTASKFVDLLQYARDEDAQRLRDGLRKAGLPP